jgi:hypothetical protein
MLDRARIGSVIGFRSRFLQGLVVRRFQFSRRSHHDGRHRHYGVNIFRNV